LITNQVEFKAEFERKRFAASLECQRNARTSA